MRVVAAIIVLLVSGAISRSIAHDLSFATWVATSLALWAGKGISDWLTSDPGRR